MNLSRQLRDLVVETYGPFFPTSKSKKEDFLDLARQKVKQYKPKIEEMCAVNMGEIHVKDFKDLRKDYITQRLQEKYQEYEKRSGKKPSRFEKGLLAFPVVTANTTFGLLFEHAVLNLVCVQAKYNNSSIYFPFSYMNRFMDLDFNDRKRNLDETVVHELSHHLWYCLGGTHYGSSSRDFRDWRVLNEGFATYCEEFYFADLYPENFKITSRKDSGVYAKGKEKVMGLVEKNGREIVLDIPKRWREFMVKQ